MWKGPICFYIQLPMWKGPICFYIQLHRKISHFQPLKQSIFYMGTQIGKYLSVYDEEACVWQWALVIFQGIDYDMDEEAFSYITAPFNPYQFEMSHLVVSMLQ